MGTVEPLVRLDPVLEMHIRDYVANRLDPAQQESFELALLEDPELAGLVAAEQQMREGMKLSTGSGTAPVVAADPEPHPYAVRPQHSARPRRAIWPALAASMVAAAIGFGSGRLSAPATDLGAQLSGADTVALDVMRGAPEPEATEVRLRPDQQWLLLMLPRPDDEHALYHATLDNAAGVTVASTQSLAPQHFGGLLWPVATALLSPGRYELSLSAPGGPALVLAIRIETPVKP